MTPDPNDFANAPIHRLGDEDRWAELKRGRSGTVRLSFTDRGERLTWGVVVASDEWDRVVALLAEYAPKPDPIEEIADAVNEYVTRVTESVRTFGAALTSAWNEVRASQGRTEASQGKP